MMNNEEPDYEEDDSWYEEAMNQLEQPLHSHGTVYSEEEIADMSPADQDIIRKRNDLLLNGYTFTEIQVGDYLLDLLVRSGVIQAATTSFVLVYKKEKHYAVIFQQTSEDETEHPVQIACMIHAAKHVGCYQFLEFIHLQEEITEDQKVLNGIDINRILTYNNKPSLQFYSADSMPFNLDLVEKIKTVQPLLFEFLNEYIILEVKDAKAAAFDELAQQLGD